MGADEIISGPLLGARLQPLDKLRNASGEVEHALEEIAVHCTEEQRDRLNGAREEIRALIGAAIERQASHSK